MEVYQYNNSTGELVGPHMCQKNPMKKGSFLIPGSSTELKPPETAVGEVAVFLNDVWTVKADNRGKQSYDDHGRPIIITLIGEDARENPSETLVKPLWDGSSFTESASSAEIQEDKNMKAVAFLFSTDWKVTRHRDQIAAGIETSMTDEEYQSLLIERQAKRDSIVGV